MCESHHCALSVKNAGGGSVIERTCACVWVRRAFGDTYAGEGKVAAMSSSERLRTSKALLCCAGD